MGKEQVIGVTGGPVPRREQGNPLAFGVTNVCGCLDIDCSHNCHL